MLKKFLIFILTFSGLVKAQSSDSLIPYPIVGWAEQVIGDFSFKDQWSYSEGVYKNQWGQLSCDGLCPPEIDRMKDEKGKIYNDSLEAFYKIIDTSHFYYTLQCESSCSEFAGTNFIEVNQIDSDSFFCQSRTTVSTHCSLYITFTKKSIKSGVRLNSIMPYGDDSYECISGVMHVEEKAWKKGILKAEFYFTFWNAADGEASEYIYWKGLIYSPIEKKY
ncbi:MAG: hypothetical protein ACHQF2_08415 [Flavobacteriales bacterium]